jgi:hypothetical protein
MHRQDLIIMPGTVARLLTAVATAAALGACDGGNNDKTYSAAATDTIARVTGPEGIMPERDLDYFPHRFPMPRGEVEPLPAQF